MRNWLGVILAPNIRGMAERRFPPVYTSRGAVEGEDWQAVAAALNERMAARRIGQQDLAARSGVSVSTIRQVQHGAGRRVQNKTLSALSLALDWLENHLATTLMTGTTTKRPEQVADPAGVAELLQQLHGSLNRIDERLTTIESTLTRATREPEASAE